jgi:hypothetical protein
LQNEGPTAVEEAIHDPFINSTSMNWRGGTPRLRCSVTVVIIFKTITYDMIDYDGFDAVRITILLEKYIGRHELQSNTATATKSRRNSEILPMGHR